MDFPSPPAPTPDIDSCRPRLFGIAYRMLGDVQEAQDLVQEAFLRWHRHAETHPAALPRSAEAWLVTVITRLAIDRLRHVATERALYTGPWLPEPVLPAPEPPPSRDAELASDLSIALLVLLERLAPEERAAFLLREVFGAEYGEIGRILDKQEAAVRQIVHRARTRVRDGRPRFSVAPETQRALLHRFLDAIAREDQDALLALLAPDATLTSDGGGKVSAARNVIVGADRLVRLLIGLERKEPDAVSHAIIDINGEPGIITYVGGRVFGATSFRTDGERVLEIYRVLNPDKLRQLGEPLSPDEWAAYRQARASSE